MNPNLNHPARKAYEQKVCEHFDDVLFGDCTANDDSFSGDFYRDEDQVAARLDGCLANVPPAVLAPGAHAEDRRPTGGRHRRPDELDDSLDMALNMFAVAMMILAAAAFATVVTVALWRAHPVLGISLIVLVGAWTAARYLPIPGTRGEGRS